MTIGWLNPKDVDDSTTVRPVDVPNAVDQRRWFRPGVNVTAQELNAILGALRHVIDFWGITDAEGDDTLLRQAIQAGAASLTGNISYLQGLIGGVDKAPYFISSTEMGLMTVTGFSRSLLALTNQAQWKSALGVDAALSANVTAFGNLVSTADTLGYFTGAGTMALTAFPAFGRSLVSSANATAGRTALELGTMATQSAAAYAALASPAFTGTPTAPTAATATNTTQIATTAYVKANLASYQPLSSVLTNLGDATGVFMTLHDDLSYAELRATLELGTAATSDVGDFASTAALALKANIASPVFTGNPQAPTQSVADDSTRIATTEFVHDIEAALNIAIALKANLASPSFSGTPSAPTAATATNTTQLATTAYVKANLASYATLASPALTGVPTAPTAAKATDTTQIATTEHVKDVLVDYAALSGAIFTGTVSVTDGDLLINRAGDAVDPLFIMSKDNGRSASIYARTGSVNRWAINLASSTSETGGNVGSNFFITRYDDSGAAIDVPFFITRSNGIVTFEHIPEAPTALVTDDSDQLATTAHVKDNLANYAALAGATFTGNVTLSSGNLTTTTGNITSGGNVTVDRAGDGADAPLFLNKDNGSSAYIVGRTGVLNRWILYVADLALESGSNAGSNMRFARFSDAGGFLGYALSIARSTGIATFEASPIAPTPATADNTTKLATTAYVKANLASYAPIAAPTFTGGLTVSSGNVSITGGVLNVDTTGDGITAQLYISSDAGDFAALYFRSGTSPRWYFAKDSVAESGGNAGSNFVLQALDDAGGSVGSVFTVARASRILNFSVSPTGPTPATADDTTKLATTAFVKANLASYQPLDATLTALAAATPAADRLWYFTDGLGAGAMTPFSAFGRTLIDDANAAAGRATLEAAHDVHTHTAVDVTDFNSALHTEINKSYVVNENYLDNPSFEVWNDSSVVILPADTTMHIADRWKAYRLTAGYTVSYATDSTLDGSRGKLRATRTAANATTEAFLFYQQIDPDRVRALAGKRVVASIFADPAGPSTHGNLIINIITGTVEANIFDPETMSFTTGNVNSGDIDAGALQASGSRLSSAGTAVTIPSNAQAIAVVFRTAPSGAAPGGDIVDFANAKLETSEVVTSFVHKPLGETVRDCARFYQKTSNRNVDTSVNMGLNLGEEHFSAGIAAAAVNRKYVAFAVQMRIAAPTVTIMNPSNGNFQIRNVTRSADFTGSAASNVTDRGFVASGTGPASTVVGDDLAFHWVADARI